jgi:hypothetical protein
MRKAEAALLTFADVDVKVGTIDLDENKTDDPPSRSGRSATARARRQPILFSPTRWYRSTSNT